MAEQARLFDEAAETPALAPAALSNDVLALAQRLHQRFDGRLYLGTSSWHFPGWAGQVWARPEPAARLSREGLRAYALHPLLRTVSLDRAFYRVLDEATARRLADQAGPAFRFVVKAPAAISDAMQRDPGSGAALAENTGFLDPRLAVEIAARPLAAGLAETLGVWVLQMSPLPPRWLDDTEALHERLQQLFEALRPALPAQTLLALEVRDAALLTPALAALLKRLRVRYCLGLHDRLPDISAQLPLLRATWPGDLVCRWNLQRGQRYAQARDAWAPFDRLQAPDLPTRNELARVAQATLRAGHRVFITINNKAEGSAPASVLALAQAIDALG